MPRLKKKRKKKEKKKVTLLPKVERINKGNSRSPCARTYGHFCRLRKNSSSLNFLSYIKIKIKNFPSHFHLQNFPKTIKKISFFIPIFVSKLLKGTLYKV